MDPRDPGKIEYALPVLFWLGILLFSSRLGSCRQVRFKFNTSQFLSNLSLISKEIVRQLPHSDTLSYLIKKISPAELYKLRHKMIQSIIRRKCLEKWRLLGKWYLISVDGTGYLGFHEEHCNKCLQRELNDGSIYYYHPVLEAKLVTANGLSLSIGTEFIENFPNRAIIQHSNEEAQDCEVMAFYRWAKKFKKEYPQLRICLLLDSLYAKRPVFKLCERFKWNYIIVFKEGSNPELYKWYELMRDKFHQKNYKEWILKDIVQKYRWISPFEHYTGEKFHIFECTEEDIRKHTTKRWVWITNIEITEKNVVKLANHGGRLRWKIENEGFNSQKNEGYELEHAYSQHPTGMKNFYLVMQIACIIDQFVQKGSLLKDEMIKQIGSLKNIAFLLLEAFRNNIIDPSFLDQRIQIRLDSG